MENQINCTPVVTSSTHLDSLDSFGNKCNNSFSDSSSELDEDKCYLMEIEQLKRENNFLRKKLEESQNKKRFSGNIGNVRRPSFNFGTSPDLRPQQPKHYIISFIDEIVKLLENFSTLFSIDLESSLTKKLAKQNAAFNELAKEKDEVMTRRLNKILLVSEEEKYAQLLDIFQEYFKGNSERSKNIKLKVESLTTEAIELGKQMAAGVKERESVKKSMRGSQFFSSIREADVKEEGLKSSIIKSTCDGQERTLSGCKDSRSKEKLFLNIF